MKILSEDDPQVIKPYSGAKLNRLGLKFKKLGVRALVQKKVCLIILAGGQGSRLGFDGPKGLYELEGIGTLFSIFQQKIERLHSEYGVRPKTFVMTSDATHEATEKFFRNTDVELFQQPSEFCLDENNNFIPLGAGYATAPNGNGGIYKAIEHIDLAPYEIVNVVSVDNVLARVCDPVSIGCFITGSFDILSKAVTRLPDEKTGVFVFTDKLEIREYSELECNIDRAQANILNHLFSKAFLMRMRNERLEYHYAHKKIKYTQGGKLVVPAQPNGYKKELFIFDSFRFANTSGVMCVPRSLEFSPLKNGIDEMTDNPRTCVRDYKKAAVLEKALCVKRIGELDTASGPNTGFVKKAN